MQGVFVQSGAALAADKSNSFTSPLGDRPSSNLPSLLTSLPSQSSHASHAAIPINISISLLVLLPFPQLRQPMQLQSLLGYLRCGLDDPPSDGLLPIQLIPFWLSHFSEFLPTSLPAIPAPVILMCASG